MGINYIDGTQTSYFTADDNATSAVYRQPALYTTPAYAGKYTMGADKQDLIATAATIPCAVDDYTFNLNDTYAGYDMYNFVSYGNPSKCWGVMPYSIGTQMKIGTYYQPYMMFTDPNACPLPIPAVKNSSSTTASITPFQINKAVMTSSSSTTMTRYLKWIAADDGSHSVAVADSATGTVYSAQINVGAANGIWLWLQGGGGGGGGTAADSVGVCGGGGGSGAWMLMYINFAVLSYYYTTSAILLVISGAGGTSGDSGNSIAVYVYANGGTNMIAKINGGGAGSVQTATKKTDGTFTLSKNPSGGDGGQATIYDAASSFSRYIYIAAYGNGCSGGNGSAEAGNAGFSCSSERKIMECCGYPYYLYRTNGSITTGKGSSSHSDGSLFGGGGGGSPCYGYGAGGQGRCYVEGSSSGQGAGVFILEAEIPGIAWEFKPPEIQLTKKLRTTLNPVTTTLLSAEILIYNKNPFDVNLNYYYFSSSSSIATMLSMSIAANSSYTFTKDTLASFQARFSANISGQKYTTDWVRAS